MRWWDSYNFFSLVCFDWWDILGAKSLQYDELNVFLVVGRVFV